MKTFLEVVLGVHYAGVSYRGSSFDELHYHKEAPPNFPPALMQIGATMWPNVLHGSHNEFIVTSVDWREPHDALVIEFESGLHHGEVVEAEYDQEFLKHGWIKGEVFSSLELQAAT